MQTPKKHREKERKNKGSAGPRRKKGLPVPGMVTKLGTQAEIQNIFELPETPSVAKG